MQLFNSARLSCPLKVLSRMLGHLDTLHVLIPPSLGSRIRCQAELGVKSLLLTLAHIPSPPRPALASHFAPLSPSVACAPGLPPCSPIPQRAARSLSGLYPPCDILTPSPSPARRAVQCVLPLVAFLRHRKRRCQIFTFDISSHSIAATARPSFEFC